MVGEGKAGQSTNHLSPTHNENSNKEEGIPPPPEDCNPAKVFQSCQVWSSLVRVVSNHGVGFGAMWSASRIGRIQPDEAGRIKGMQRMSRRRKTKKSDRKAKRNVKRRTKVEIGEMDFRVCCLQSDGIASVSTWWCLLTSTYTYLWGVGRCARFHLAKPIQEQPKFVWLSKNQSMY